MDDLIEIVRNPMFSASVPPSAHVRQALGFRADDSLHVRKLNSRSLPSVTQGSVPGGLRSSPAHIGVAGPVGGLHLGGRAATEGILM
jgi:hypothetical protein